MKDRILQAGFTLVELMVTVGIIGVLSAIAIPAYNGYIDTSATGAAQANAKSLAGFEDTYFYDNGTYLGGTYDPPGTDTADTGGTLTGGLSWAPSGDNDNYKYEVTKNTTGTIANGYIVTVTYKPKPSISATVKRLNP